MRASRWVVRKPHPTPTRFPRSFPVFFSLARGRMHLHRPGKTAASGPRGSQDRNSTPHCGCFFVCARGHLALRSALSAPGQLEACAKHSGAGSGNGKGKGSSKGSTRVVTSDTRGCIYGSNAAGQATMSFELQNGTGQDGWTLLDPPIVCPCACAASERGWRARLASVRFRHCGARLTFSGAPPACALKVSGSQSLALCWPRAAAPPGRR